MIRGIVATLSFLMFWAMLCPLPVSETAEKLLLVSSLEQAPSETNACRFYALDPKTRAIQELYKIPFNKADGMAVVRIDAYPELRRLVIWAEKLASHEVEARVIDIDRLAETGQVAFPKSGIAPLCYYVDNPTSGPLLVLQDRAFDPVSKRMNAAQDKLYTALLPIVDRQVEAPKEVPSVDGRNVLLPGDSDCRLPVFSSVALRYDAPLRRFVQDDTRRIRVEFPVDEKTAALMESQPTLPGTGRLFCNDDRAALISWGHVQPERGTGRCFYLLRRDAGSWKQLIAKGDTSKPQMFQDWIVVQEIFWRGPAVARMTGEFQLYSRDEETSFTWRATSDDRLAQDTEIVAMWEKDFVYRLGTTLYQADIGNGKVSNERLIFDGKDVYQGRINLIQAVHWVFRMKE
jgi:hypothetical protein